MGLCNGTYDQVAAHEKEHGRGGDSHGGHDPPPHELPNVMKDSNEHAAHIYHAADGFKGTFEQVEAHEKEHGLHWDKEGGHDPPPHKLKEWFASGKNKQEEEEHLAHIYHASDGFTGTFEQVEAHEKQHGLHWDSHDPPPHKLKNAVKNEHVDVAHMYHAPDGFVGTYDQVVAHEKKHNLDCEHQDDPPPGWAAPIANDPVGAEETKEESSMMSRMVRRTREEETCSPPPGEVMNPMGGVDTTRHARASKQALVEAAKRDNVDEMEKIYAKVMGAGAGGGGSSRGGGRN